MRVLAPVSSSLETQPPTGFSNSPICGGENVPTPSYRLSNIEHEVYSRETGLFLGTIRKLGDGQGWQGHPARNFTKDFETKEQAAEYVATIGDAVPGMVGSLKEGEDAWG